MLGGKNCKNMDIVSPFPAEIIDLYTRGMKEAPVTKVYVLYSKLMLIIKTDNCCKGWVEQQLMQLNYCLEQFKRALVRTFRDHCIFGLYTVTLHLLGQVVEGLQPFDTLSVLPASPFEQYSLNINNAYKQTSSRRARVGVRQWGWQDLEWSGPGLTEGCFPSKGNKCGKCKVDSQVLYGANLGWSGENVLVEYL